jgi:lipopolysaccharide transport system ATP-binding protein
MDAELAISLNHVSKCFKRYNRPADRLKEMFFPHKFYAQEFWALQDISFQVAKGETMGIIGCNGAGKSTLLQIICGTLTPTSGHVQVNGRVSALLELGAGFNPEFTGRDNVYMNCAIMGLAKEEVDARFDQIAAFADINDFIDRPVKTYSSGMYIRLAFSAAIHVDPDILIVDEALSVGDMYFQAKCMAKMRQMMNNGVTVLFVSHDVSSVKSLCQRAVYLKDHYVHSLGKSGEIVDEYVKDQFLAMKSIDNFTDKSESIVVNSESRFESIGSSSQELLAFKEGVKLFRKGNGLIKAINVVLLNDSNEKTSDIKFGDYLTIRVFCEVFEQAAEAVVAFYIKDKNQIEIIGSNNVYEEQNLQDLSVGEKICVDFKLQNRLRGGAYSITIIIASSLQEPKYFDWIECAAIFNSGDLPNKPLWSQVSLPLETSIIRLK